MRRPPMLMHVKIHGEDRGFCLWLPLFLLLPVALVLLIVFSPLILLALFILWLSGRGKRVILVTRIACRLLFSLPLIRAAVDLLCSAPGLRVDISSHNDRVCIFIT